MRPLKLSPSMPPAVPEYSPTRRRSAPIPIPPFDEYFTALTHFLDDPAATAKDPEFFSRYPELIPLMDLSHETDFELFWHDLFRLGSELGDRGNLELWAFTMDWMQQQDLPLKLQKKVGEESHLRNWERTLPRLLQECLDPKILLAMGVGRLAFHQARLTSLRWLVHAGSPKTLRNTLALGGGIFAETLSFHASWQMLQRWLPGPSTHSIPWEESLLSSALILSFVRSGDGIAKMLLPKSGMIQKIGSAAMQMTSLTLALGLEPWLAGEPLPSPAQTLETILTTFLQWRLSEALMIYFGGPNLLRLEHHGEALATQWQWSPTRQVAMGPVPKVYWMEGTPNPQRLDYRKNFPQEGSHHFSEEIIAAWEKTLLPLEIFRQRLIEAYSRAPNRGSREQLHTAIAIQKLFRFNALNSSHGSLDNALLQLALGQILAIPSGVSRNHIMQDLFRQMESGWSRDKFIHFSVRYPVGGGFEGVSRPKYSAAYHRKHFNQLAKDWSHLMVRERRLLWNHIFFESGGKPRATRRMIRHWGQWTQPKQPGSKMHREVLEMAYLHRQGRLLLRRLENILRAGDHPAKIRELLDLSEGPNTIAYFETTSSGILDESFFTKKLQASSHDAFMKDKRLARKLQSVIPEITPYLYGTGKRLDQVQHFRETIRSRYDGNLNPEFLLEILMRHPSSQSQQLIEAVHADLIDIKMMPESHFLQMKRKWSQDAQVEVGFYRPQNILGRPDELILREMPDLPLHTEAGAEQAVFQVGLRLKALIHEFEHWRHFRGYFSGIEKGAQPFPMKKLSRHERITSEMMAVLEEQRWTNQYFGVDLWRTATRLSPHWMAFLRDSHGLAYPPPRQQKK